MAGKIKYNQLGFSAVEVVLVLVILGLIGLVGFAAYKSYSKAKDSTITTSSSDRSTQAKTSTSDTTKQPTISSNPAVVISEWNIKVEFADANEVTYKMSADSSGKQYASFYLKDSVATVCQALGVGFSRDTTSSGGDNSSKIANYYYQLVGGPGACGDDPGGTNGSINQLRARIDGNELGAGKYTVTPAR